MNLLVIFVSNRDIIMVKIWIIYPKEYSRLITLQFVYFFKKRENSY